MFVVLLILSFTALSFALSSTNLILNADYSTSYSVDCSAYSYFQVDFPFPCQDLNITLTAVLGDLEIYVSKKIQFVQKTDLNWGAINQDSLVISHWDPESSPGMYYIAVYNNCKGKQKQGSFKIAVRSSNDTDDHDDIYLHPSLTRNKLIAANGYEYFRFCVPKCADVIVTLENCMDYTTCPFSYSFPEMLLTRTERDPNINDYTYKLASNYRRFIKVNHTDPAALDRNGFLTGSYYVGIFGWCTPDDQVVNWETDGPCSLAANTTFNITVDMTFYPDDKCSSQNWIIPQAESDVIPVNLDTVIHGTVACNDYRYYTVAVTKPCTSLNIWIGNNTINTSVAELAIAKYPNLRPTFDNIAWTSYNFYYQNLTIDLYDPNFDTGYICGPHYNTTCIYYIGVYGYCAADNIPVNYSMIIKTISETTSENIFNQIQRNQQLTPKLIDSTTSTYSYSSHYTFCANNENEINAYFYLWETGCNCMNDYSDLQLVISRTERNATIGDLTWSIDSDEEYHHLVLNSYNDTAFREGTFYVNVWSSCTPNNLCDDICTCSPCSNLPTTKYGLYITNQTNFNYSANVDKFLDTCDNLGTCSSTCSSTSETTSSNDDKLSTSDKVGIALGVFFFVVIVLVVLYSTGYFAYQRFKYSRAEMTNPTGRTMGEREDSFSGIDENALDGVHLTQGRALVTREGIELKV